MRQLPISRRLCKIGTPLQRPLAMDSMPPFRADHVGSLLRPQPLAELRARFKRGEVNAVALREAEDAAVREAVQRQQDIGLQAVTDGEFRRDWWHLDFLAQLDGVTLK